MTFTEHKETTIQDCESIIAELEKLIAQIKEGNMNAFEQFWYAGGTEEGDSKIQMWQEIILLRYYYRLEQLDKNKQHPSDTTFATLTTEFFQ